MILLKSQTQRPASVAAGVDRCLQEYFASNKPQVAQRDPRLFLLAAASKTTDLGVPSQ
jgi:hypothetical protein